MSRFWKHRSYVEQIQPYIDEQVRLNDDAIETMIEMMLVQDGTDYGVLVLSNPDGTVTVGLSPGLPFGRICYVR